MDTPGERLRHVRELSGLSARELDRLAGQPEGHATMIERRSAERVWTDTAASYAQVVGVTLDWLVRGVGDRPTKKSVRAAVERARDTATAG
jgi:transcriptional regulator with XRE-family HTH domain